MRDLELTRRYALTGIVAAGLGVIAGSLGAQSTPSQYQVVRELKLGGEGRWDYIVVDTARNRLFIARQTRVMVVDEKSGKLLGEIPNIDGAHGVALDYADGHGFATAGKSGTVTMFDLATLQPRGAHPAGDGADAILYDPASRRVFSFNGRANSSSVIDPVSGESIATIPLNGKPEFGVSAGDGKVFLNIEDRSEMDQIDAKAAKVARRWPLAPCVEPTGLAFDRVHQRLFSVCSNQVMAISDAQKGKVIATIPIGEHVDGAGFDPETRLAFASNGEGSLTVVREEAPNQFRRVATVPTREGARTMALDLRTHQIFTVTTVSDTFTLLVLDRH
jgi:DNA-binding beta-propeller fold protein YncE